MASLSSRFRFFRSLGLLVLAVPCFSLAQEAAPAPASPSPVALPGGANSYESKTLLGLVDRVFDVESDSLDPEEGTLNWKGRSFQIGEGRMMRARFVRYLNTPVNSMDSRLYLSLLDQIEGRLSVLTKTDEPEDEDEPWKPVISAWKLLFQAGDFDVDGGNSRVIANLVYDNWRDREMFQNQQFREEVEIAEQERLENSAVRETQIEERRRIQNANDLGRLQQDGIEIPSFDGDGFTPMAQAMRRLAEQEALLAAQGLKIQEIGLKARLKMQTQIISFLGQRRFKHAMILSSFYRALFNSSAQDLEVDGKQLISYLPELEMLPTVDSLEFVAIQAMDDVRTGMESVNNAYEQGQMISALERLQETFFLGEYSLDVVLFPEEKKQVLRDLYLDLDEARRLAELKDYDALEKLVSDIAALADDFPDREALSSIRVAKQGSRMKLLAARGAMMRGEINEAQALLDDSFRIWPLNPDIETFMTGAISGADELQDFDLDYENGDYRRIFDRRETYMAALSGDRVRAQQMRESIEIVQTIDFAVQAAEQRWDRGEPYAAWEILKEVEDIAGDDLRYNRAVSDIAPAIARFVETVSRAESLEEEGNYPAALTKYAAARKLFPASQVVARSIERLAGLMLDQAQQLQANRAAPSSSSSL